ncbi:MAG TPA: Uma2 family endonuclease [Bryobacteraceae bacterium]|jgi:Uma2 family endonuclease|nr:Uma2 family endonuclease [Bryobacteraceae bacterium]
MATATTMSGATFDQLPYEEGRHLELLHGEVITVPRPTPKHQISVTILTASLLGYFEREPGGVALPDCEFAIGEDDRLCPDGAILLKERWASIDPDKTPIPLAPDIAVEVLSPSERTTDSMRKVWTYLEAGTREVWQFQPDSQKVLVYRSAKSITVLDIGESLSTPLLPGWEISVRKIFSTKQ